MANYTKVFSKIADDLPQVVDPETGEYLNVGNYKWAFLIKEDNEPYWDDNSGYGNGLNSDQDGQGNVYYSYNNLYFIPTVAYFGIDNIKLEKGLYISNSELDSKICNAVRLISINTGGDID